MLVGEMHWGTPRRVTGGAVSGTAGLVMLALDAAHAAKPAGSGNKVLRAPEAAAAIRSVQAAPPAGNPVDGVQWPGARYESLAAFIQALQAERYTPLVFKRLSADLRRGHGAAMTLLLQRFHKERWRRNLPGETPAEPAQLLQSVAEDTRAAIDFANKSTDLAVPDFMVEPVISLTQRLVHRIYRLPGEAPAAADRVPVPESTTQDEQSEPKARAENTGLYHDVVDFVKQEHLQYLVGGDALTVRARLLAEVLKIAQSDNLVVDEKSVTAFADRLVEAGVVGAEQRDLLADGALAALSLKPDWPQSDRAHSPAPRPSQEETATSNDTATAPSPGNQQGPSVAHDQLAPESVVSETEGISQGNEPLQEMTQPDIATPPSRAAPAVPVIAAPAPTVPTVEKGDMLFVVETGLGITLPAQNGDIDPVGQSAVFDPGIAARFGLGATWPEAVGPAHLSLSLMAVVGEAKADRLKGVAGSGTINTRGSNSYIGAMPFLSVELPLTSGVNVRLGGGVGVAYQSLEVLSGAAKLVDADGVSLLAQVGGGLRFTLAPCIDWGLDVFATHLDSVKGTGIGGAPVKFGGAWDVAAYATVRVGIGSPAQKPGCNLFAP